MKYLNKYPPNEEIYKFLEECQKNNIQSRPVTLLFDNYGMPFSLGIEFQKEFYERKKKGLIK